MKAFNRVAQGHLLYAYVTLGNYSRVITIIIVIRRLLELLSNYTSYIKLNYTIRYKLIAILTLLNNSLG